MRRPLFRKAAMYIKIVNRTTEATKTLQCSSVRVIPQEEQTVVDYTYNGQQLAEICKPGVDVIYLLNDFGKTIDTYRV